MLYSVFNKRKVQKKFASIHPGRRAASPPSPASFSSHDAVKIHGDANPRFLQPETVTQSSTPQVQLDLNYRESYSDWFPTDLLRSGARTPPERNVSLQRGGGSVPSIAGTTVVDSRTGTPAISFTSSVDDILIIETAPGSGLSRELPPLPTADYDSDNQASVETNSNPSVSRKPTPTPIRIPDNHAGAKIHIQRSASAGTSAGPSSYLPVPGSNGPSRPASPGSDDLSSSVSGTTLARALVASSFVLTNDSRGSRYRSGITRQDSATLPRGEHPLHGRFSARASGEFSSETGLRSPIPPVPPLPSSAELSARSRVDSNPGSRSRRSSYSGAGESRRASLELPCVSEQGTSRRSSMNGMPRDQVAAFSPISPITEAPSPAPSAPNTPTFMGNGSAGASSSSLAQSSSQSRSTNLSESLVASSSSSLRGVDHRRLSTEPSRSSFDDGSDRDDATRLPTLIVRGSSLSPGPDTGTTASVYSAASYSRASISTPGTSVKSPYTASSPTNRMSRSHSDSSTHGHRGAGPYRSVTLLPIGERPHSVQVPQSPVSARTSSDSDLRRPFAMPSLPGSARVSGGTPVDSPDLLDIMFPVAPAALARERPGRGRERTGSQLAPLDIVPGVPDLSTPVLSSDSESIVHASGQTFPETPYAFSPLLSAGMASPIPPPPPPLRGGVRALPRTMTLNRTGATDMKTRWGTRGALVRSTTGVRAPPTPPSSVESVYGSSSGHSEHATSATSDLSIRPMPVLSAIEETNHTPSNSPSPAPRSRSISQTRSPSPKEMDPQQDDDATVITFTTSSEASVPSHPLQVIASSSPHHEMQEDSPPPAYMSMQEAAASGPSPTAHLEAEPADDRGQLSRQSSLRSDGTHLSYRLSVAKPGQSLTLSPLPSPPPSAPPVHASSVPPSPMPSIEEHSMAEQAPPPPYVEEIQRPAVSITAPPAPPFVAPAVPSRVATPELQVPKRNARTRPPLPVGPRRPLVSTRSRTGSVSSSISNPSGPSSMRRPSVPTLSASSPRFQTTPVKFRGLTKEAAEWTFSSQQLQQLVSTAIRQTADVSAIRLLPLDILNEALPEEINRLEALSAELRTNYKLNVRRRRMILGSLASMVDGSEPSESGVAGRMVEELSEITDSLDQISEELYDVTTQLGQLTHLRDVHSSSALIMALHKLNKSLKKHLEEGQKLREQVTALEAERDEAWKQAQEVAQDFDDLAERADQTTPSAREVSTSRRSSRVVLARKNSARVAKAGLRSSLHRRSQRSSVSSGHQNSISPSPALWSAQIGDIPPVPPIPLRGLGILTDLPTSRTGMMSETPSSEFRAMTEAQKELCDMLGISLDDLKTQQPSRRQSMSAALGARTPVPISPSRARRNSDSLAIAQSAPASAQGLFRI